MGTHCGCSLSGFEFRSRTRSSVFDENSDKSQMIDNELRREAILNLKILKILLLGPSNSGKSTVAKQMKILHTKGFAESEVAHYKYTVHSNFIDALGHIARGVYELQIEVPAQERELVEAFAESHNGNISGTFDTPEGVIQQMRTFLGLSTVRQACTRINEFHVPDNTEYLLNNTKRLLQSEYSPTREDILQARASTLGIYEIVFAFRRFTIRLIDVGGQKTERRKWIHCFEGVSAILFIVSLSCYNEAMEEDSAVNQMSDSVELFKAMWKSSFLRGSPFILFLNKKDVFARKLRFDPLQRHFSAFRERISSHVNLEDQLYLAAVEFIRQMLVGVARESSAKRPIYSHVTNATDTRNINFVFNASYDIVIERNVSSAGMS